MSQGPDSPKAAKPMIVPVGVSRRGPTGPFVSRKNVAAVRPYPYNVGLVKLVFLQKKLGTQLKRKLNKFEVMLKVS
jgi:hypothetical protein